MVFAQPYPLARVPGLLLGVQSPVADPAALVKEFEAYLTRQSDALGSMSDEVFNGQRMALAARLREKPRSLAEKTGRLWSDLGLGSNSFDDLEQVAREVEALGRDNWLEWFRSRMAGADRHAMVLYSTGEAHRAKASVPPPGRRVDAAGRWKSNAKYYRFEWALPTQDPERALH